MIFPPSILDRRRGICSYEGGEEGGGGIAVRTRDIECALTRHPRLALYSLPDNYNDNEASDTIEGGVAKHGRVRYFPFFDLFPPLRPPCPSSAAAGFCRNSREFCLLATFSFSTRISRAVRAAPEYYYSHCVPRRAIVFNHNAPFRKFRKAMRYTLYVLTTGNHRRISERFSLHGYRNQTVKLNEEDATA